MTDIVDAIADKLLEDHMALMKENKMNDINTIKINEIEYIRADSLPPIKPKITGTRAIIVVDRGWIFAGDVARENGRIKLTNALHVFKWASVGFAGMIENTSKADLRKIADVDIPEGAEIFCVPVPDTWGL